jgi:hypothetical protein
MVWLKSTHAQIMAAEDCRRNNIREVAGYHRRPVAPSLPLLNAI